MIKWRRCGAASGSRPGFPSPLANLGSSFGAFRLTHSLTRGVAHALSFRGPQLQHQAPFACASVLASVQDRSPNHTRAVPPFVLTGSTETKLPVLPARESGEQRRW